MLIQYVKQVWMLIRQEKLFSGIYIAGTGLSVTVVMVLSILLYIELANIYPETNRDRTLYVKYGFVKSGNSSSSAAMSYQTVESCFRDMESIETLAVEYMDWREEYYVQVPGQKEDIEVGVQYVDANWWKVFPFVFRDGAAFTAADHSSGILTAVITQSLARKIFGTTEATGKYFSLNFKQFRVAGVVKDVPAIMKMTYANIWLPYTVHPNYKDPFDRSGLLGAMNVYLLAPTVGDLEKVEIEARENLRKYGATFEDIEFDVVGQPDRHWMLLFRDYWSNGGDYIKGWYIAGLIFLVVLLIPAVALSGMVDSRMERRIAELGVRRAFGASSGLLLKQILYENMLFTLAGGLVGLCFSYLFLYLGRELVLLWGGDFLTLPAEGADLIFSPEMFLNVPVFLITLLICMILNVLSAIIPAWRASRREIVYSLTSK